MRLETLTLHVLLKIPDCFACLDLILHVTLIGWNLHNVDVSARTPLQLICIHMVGTGVSSLYGFNKAQWSIIMDKSRARVISETPKATSFTVIIMRTYLLYIIDFANRIDRKQFQCIKREIKWLLFKFLLLNGALMYTTSKATICFLDHLNNFGEHWNCN